MLFPFTWQEYQKIWAKSWFSEWKIAHRKSENSVCNDEENFRATSDPIPKKIILHSDILTTYYVARKGSPKVPISKNVHHKL